MNIYDKYDKLVQVIKQRTIDKTLDWIPLTSLVRKVSNHNLESYLIKYNKYLYTDPSAPFLEEYASYYYKHKGGYVYLFRIKKHKKYYYVLAIQAEYSCPIIEVTNEDYKQVELEEIVNEISIIDANTKSMDFIDSIIS